MFINQLITSHNWGAPSCRHKMLGESLYGMFTINWCRISQPSTVRLGLEDLKGFVGSYLGVKLSVRCGKPKWFPKESDLQMVVFTHPCQFTGEYVCVVFVQYLHTIYYITFTLTCACTFTLQYSTVHNIGIILYVQQPQEEMPKSVQPGCQLNDIYFIFPGFPRFYIFGDCYAHV